MVEDKKGTNSRQAKYRFKSFFWSLNQKSTFRSNSEIQNRHNDEIQHKKKEN